MKALEQPTESSSNLDSYPDLWATYSHAPIAPAGTPGQGVPKFWFPRPSRSLEAEPQTAAANRQGWGTSPLSPWPTLCSSMSPCPSLRGPAARASPETSRVCFPASPTPGPRRTPTPRWACGRRRALTVGREAWSERAGRTATRGRAEAGLPSPRPGFNPPHGELRHPRPGGDKSPASDDAAPSRNFSSLTVREAGRRPPGELGGCLGRPRRRSGGGGGSGTPRRRGNG